MLVIWRGFGWLIPVIVFGAFLLSQIALNSIYGEGFYKANEWPKIVAIVFISLLIASLGYFLNYKKRQVTIDEESGKKKKSPAHSLFFIPVEAWAVIIPVLFFWMQIQTAKTDAKEMAFIESPAVNDVYSVDFTEIFTDTDQKFKYGTLKVVEVKSDGVEVLASEIAYDGKSGVRKDVREGKANNQGYYSGEPFFIPRQYIIELKNQDGIFQVSR
ncbi:hypothetical protein [Alcanivorax sp. DP30]|uniref:hypothetical protein n=1 Tax=Alcanivorax sp. DP30 TaxID=2606217 RepID=UPI00137134BF|nr:hypothetical protein [Alcanivorax sp. DP30]MZR63111.1 hypothetical protein [Alcanivorax sp. DP30]